MRSTQVSLTNTPLTPSQSARHVIYQPHDHNACIAAALERAEARCAERGTRLTELRAQVLRLIWQNHTPLGAYTLMEMLAKASTRRVAPPTVYRALDFLLDEKLIHRINSLNAFIGCPHSHQEHASHFLICENCHIAIELDDAELNKRLMSVAESAGFKVRSHSVELLGRCPNCQLQLDVDAAQSSGPQHEAESL